MPILPYAPGPTKRATTQAAGDNSTLIATDAFVTTAVNNAIAGVNPAVAVQWATVAAGDTSALTYNNGVSGVGATMTGANNTVTTIDGHAFVVGDVGVTRLLIKNDTQSPSGAFNGVYLFTALHTAGTGDIFTRALDYDTPSDINNTGAIPVISGTANASTSWVETANITSVGVTPLAFTEFTLNPTTLMTTTVYDPAAIAQQVVGTTASQAVTNKVLSDAFMGNAFESLSATKRDITLLASTNFEDDDHVEIGASFTLEIPASSTLEIRVYPQQNTTNILANKTLLSPLFTGFWDGWISIPNGIQQNSATVITMGASIDVIDTFAVGDKIRLVQGGSILYFYVVGISGQNVTVTGGSDYTITVPGPALTSFSYSKMSSPTGFPQWFNYTSSPAGWASTTISIARFSVQGRSCTVNTVVSGTSNATTATSSLPITSATLTNNRWVTALPYSDNGAPSTTLGLSQIQNNSATLSFFRDNATTPFTATGLKAIQTTITFEI